MGPGQCSLHPQSSWPGLAGRGLGRSGPSAKGDERQGGWVSINKSNNVGRTSAINRETGASQHGYPSPKAFSLTCDLSSAPPPQTGGAGNHRFYYHHHEHSADH